MDLRERTKYNSGTTTTRRKDMEQASIMLEFTQNIDQESDFDKIHNYKY